MYTPPTRRETILRWTPDQIDTIRDALRRGEKPVNIWRNYFPHFPKSKVQNKVATVKAGDRKRQAQDLVLSGTTSPIGLESALYDQNILKRSNLRSQVKKETIHMGDELDNDGYISNEEFDEMTAQQSTKKKTIIGKHPLQFRMCIYLPTTQIKRRQTTLLRMEKNVPKCV